ncbi:hypothetical protein [Streptomyces flavalbus]|uniref:Uncharacterized protein n=1 Tax=Streptomyces flavalbus TaxID=2665155 RepID=A0ABW2WED7_9ACTN
MSGFDSVISAILLAMLIALVCMMFDRENGRNWRETVQSSARAFRYGLGLWISFLIIYGGAETIDRL